MPPLNPLRTFEVAAHCQSFTEAAEELGVTQAAVSRQIRVLEGFFKTRLFERDVRSIRLTPIGQQLHNEVSSAFEIIRWSSERIFQDGSLVRVQTYPTFAARWLMPRLSQFLASFPATDIRVQAGVKPVDFNRSDTDIAIQFGRGDWPDVCAHPLIRDEIEPVCSPKIFDAKRHKPDELQKQTLLNSKFRSRDWSDWLINAGGPARDSVRWLTFESSLLTYQAAIEGLGVAMGQTSLLSQEFKSGTLIRPFKLPLSRDLHYWVVWPAHRRLSKEANRFVDWLTSQGDPKPAA
jgi:LysR family glycine cleavage system transcriptional activator